MSISKIDIRITSVTAGRIKFLCRRFFFLQNLLTNIYVLHIIHIDDCLLEVFRLDAKKMALIFKAFCDENRIRILKMLRSGEKCACKMLDELNVTQPTLSHHMKILCDSGIVLGRKEGKWMYYSISAEGAKVAADCIKELTSAPKG